MVSRANGRPDSDDAQKHRFMTDKSKSQLAVDVITAIRIRLSLGHVHRNRAGRILSTVHEVLLCLSDEGGVQIEEPPRPAS